MLRRHREPRARAARARALARRTCAIARALFLTDAVPAGSRGAGRRRGRPPIAPIDSRDAYSQLMLKSLLPHIDTPHVLRRPVGRLRRQPAGVGPGVPRLRLHRRQVVLARRRHARRQRRLLAALAQAARRAAGSAHRAGRRRGHDHRPHLPAAARARARHPLRRRSARRPLFVRGVRIPIGKPFGFHGLFNFCRTVPPARDRRARARAFPTRSRARRSCLQLLRNCIALGQWDAARGDRAADARRDARTTPRRGRCSRRRSARRRDAGRRTQRSLPVRQRQEIQALPRRARHAAPEHRPQRHDAGAIVRAAVAAHQRGDLDGAERGYRDALARHPGIRSRCTTSASRTTSATGSTRRCRCSSAAVARVPQEAEFHNNLGLALAAADRNDEAIAAYRRALELSPTTRSRGAISGSRCSARTACRRRSTRFASALALAPDFAQAHWNLGARAARAPATSPKAGANTNGASRSRARAPVAHAGPVRAGTAPMPARPHAARHRRAGTGRHAAVHPPRAAARRAQARASSCSAAGPARAPARDGAGRCARVIGPDDAPPPYDAHAAADVALAGMLGIDADVDSRRPCPTSPPIRARRAEAAAIAGARPAGVRRVGLAWAGNRATRSIDRRGRFRSPSLAPLLRAAGHRLVLAAAKRRRGGDRERAAGGARSSACPCATISTARRRWSRSSISSSASTRASRISPARSRGRRGCMLRVRADWRWHTSAADTPWYPTFRLFRQPRALGDWDAARARGRDRARRDRDLQLPHQPLDRVSEGLNRRAIAEDPLRVPARVDSASVERESRDRSRGAPRCARSRPRRGDEIVDAGELAASPALCRPRMKRPGSVTIGSPQASASRLVLPPDQRSVSSIASQTRVDAQVVVVAALRQQDQPRSSSPSPARANAPASRARKLRRERGMPALEQRRAAPPERREHAREQRVVVGMDLEQRLRAQKQRHAFGQSEAARASRRGHRRTRVVGADARQRASACSV